MAKTNITLYSSTPSSNTDINNINIDENCPASGLNNAIRELMAHLKNVDTGSQALTALSVTGVGTFGSLDISGDIDVDGTTNLDNTDIDGNLDVTGASNSVVTSIKPQGALPDNNDNAGLYVLHQGTAGTGLRVRTDNALTGSNFAHILVNNASASINAFQVSQYGSGLIAKFDKSGTTAMQIDNAGHVTMPNQPAFSANLGAASQTNIAVGSDITVEFDNEIFDQNSDYNTSTYKFTAPVTGKYQFNIYYYLENIDTATGYYYIYFDTSNRNYFNIISPAFTADTDYLTLTLSVLADMDVNDVAFCRIRQSHGTSQTDINANSYFSGYLVA